jgi:transcription antitermination factor NusG
MGPAETEPWFALQVIPRHEAKVGSILAWKGHQYLLPTSRVRRQWSDRVKAIEQPVFPGYIFCTSQRSLLMGLIRSTPGIIRVVSFGGKPHPVSEEEIQAMQRIVQADREICSFPYLAAGQKVKIIAGPLAGITGIITKLRNRDRLVISVDAIMRSLAVEVDRTEIAPAQATTLNCNYSPADCWSSG